MVSDSNLFLSRAVNHKYDDMLRITFSFITGHRSYWTIAMQ